MRGWVMSRELIGNDMGLSGYGVIWGAQHSVNGVMETISFCPSWDWKWEPPEYKSEVLLLESACLMYFVCVWFDVW
jgi:hypothetical protein